MNPLVFLTKPHIKIMLKQIAVDIFLHTSTEPRTTASVILSHEKNEAKFSLLVTGIEVPDCSIELSENDKVIFRVQGKDDMHFIEPGNRTAHVVLICMDALRHAFNRSTIALSISSAIAEQLGAEESKFDMKYHFDCIVSSKQFSEIFPN